MLWLRRCQSSTKIVFRNKPLSEKRAVFLGGGRWVERLGKLGKLGKLVIHPYISKFIKFSIFPKFPIKKLAIPTKLHYFCINTTAQ